MLAITRVLMTDPEPILTDEPCDRLAPVTVLHVERIIHGLRAKGLALLVEQNLHGTLELANRFYVLETGQVVHEDTVGGTGHDQAVLARFFGVQRRFPWIRGTVRVRKPESNSLTRTGAAPCPAGTLLIAGNQGAGRVSPSGGGALPTKPPERSLNTEEDDRSASRVGRNPMM